MKTSSKAVVLGLSLLMAGMVSARAASMKVLVGTATANDAQAAITTKFAQLITKYSHGRLHATARTASSLGNNAQMLATLQAGALQGMVLPTGFESTIVHQMSLFDLPFLLPPEPAAITAFCAQSKAAALMTKLAAKKGIHVIGFTGIGAQSLLTKFPVHGLADLKGKKFRVIPSPPRIGAFKDWGMLPRPVPLNEVYTGLQQGTFLGMASPPDTLYKMKLYEVAPYFTITNHISFVENIIVSKVWFDHLPKALQRAVTRAGKAAMVYSDKTYTRDQKTSLAALRKVITVTNMPPAQLAKMKELAKQGIWKKEEANPIMAPIIKLLEQDLARYNKSHT